MLLCNTDRWLVCLQAGRRGGRKIERTEEGKQEATAVVSLSHSSSVLRAERGPDIHYGSHHIVQVVFVLIIVITRKGSCGGSPPRHLTTSGLETAVVFPCIPEITSWYGQEDHGYRH